MLKTKVPQTKRNATMPAKEMSSSPPPAAAKPDNPQKVTPQRRNKKASTLSILMNKQKKNHGPKNHHLTVNKEIVDELLLVCGVIGYTEDSDSQKIVPVEDCYHWLQDLHRALRRDEDAYRPISLLLGQWKIVQQKLLPLVLSCRYDTPLVLSIVKILVILTQPMSEYAMNAGRLIIDTKSGKVDAAVIEEQIKLRDNAIAQANLLTEYKKMFVYHPSHRQKKSKKQSKGGDDGAKGLLSVFVSLLTEPLSRTGMARTNEDHLLVEVILHLFRNLLCAGEPLFKDSNNVQESTKLHQELIALFEKEMVLDILLVIGQEMESRENTQYNLLLMEILHHLLKSQDPTLVARSTLSKAPKKHPITNTRNRFRGSQSSTLSTGNLRQKLQQERQLLHAANSSRHSHFGGTLVVQNSDGDQKFVAATASNKSFQHGNSKLSEVELKRKTKKHQYFIGSTKPDSAYYTRSGEIQSSTTYCGPSSQRAQCVLHNFCSKFLQQCYGPVMKTLKDEFRRDSNRLLDEDKVVFFRILWFFCQWWRVCLEDDHNMTKELKSSSVGKLVFTMDVFTFNFVLTSLDYFLEHKKYKNLSQTVSLYTEMMKLLNSMYQSSDSMENIMAMGLMDHLFYKQDPLDKLPKLLSKWTTGVFNLDYLCNLVELTHVTLKLLESNEKECSDSMVPRENKKKRGKNETPEPLDRVTRMKQKAAEFDTTVYLSRKIVSNQVVFMFTQLLAQYNCNASSINDHIAAFFVRLCKFVVATDDDFMRLDTEKEENLKSVTLEPMLFNIHLLNVVNGILNNPNIRDDKSYRSLINFGSTLIRHFAKTCEKNPMLFVETLFRHPVPHRYCEMLSNNYLSEELKMIAEREILLEQQSKSNTNNSDDDAGDVSSNEEEEMEFGDEGEKRNRRLVSVARVSDKATKKDDDEDSSDEEQELEFDDVKEVTKSSDIVDKEDDERWSDRRAFVAKRKRMDLDRDDSIVARESPKDLNEAHSSPDNYTIQSDDEKKDESPAPTKDILEENDEGSKMKRIKRAVPAFEDSSDEEEFGDTQITNVQSQQGSQPNFDDSDDEE